MAAPAAVKPTVGKKLLAPVAKANPGNATSAASTPVKPPSVAPAKKATALVTEKAPAGDGPSPKGTGKGKTSEAEKAPKAPRAKNAYMFFMADKRDAVKGELMFASTFVPGHASTLPSWQDCCRYQGNFLHILLTTWLSNVAGMSKGSCLWLQLRLLAFQ